jgi:hypothetical protein
VPGRRGHRPAPPAGAERPQPTPPPPAAAAEPTPGAAGGRFFLAAGPVAGFWAGGRARSSVCAYMASCTSVNRVNSPICKEITITHTYTRTRARTHTHTHTISHTLPRRVLLLQIFVVRPASQSLARGGQPPQRPICLLANRPYLYLYLYLSIHPSIHPSIHLYNRPLCSAW